MTPDEHQADKSARAVAEVLRTARAVLMAPSYAEAMAAHVAGELRLGLIWGERLPTEDHESEAVAELKALGVYDLCADVFGWSQGADNRPPDSDGRGGWQ